MERMKQVDPTITRGQAQRAIDTVLSIVEFVLTPQYVIDPAKLDIDTEELKGQASLLTSHKQNYGAAGPTITPTHFTAREGSAISLWLFSPIPYTVLSLRDPYYIQPLIDQPGVQVHAFFFGEPNDDWASFGRWDCVNGWAN